MSHNQYIILDASPALRSLAAKRDPVSLSTRDEERECESMTPCPVAFSCKLQCKAGTDQCQLAVCEKYYESTYCDDDGDKCYGEFCTWYDDGTGGGSCTRDSDDKCTVDTLDHCNT